MNPKRTLDRAGLLGELQQELDVARLSGKLAEYLHRLVETGVTVALDLIKNSLQLAQDSSVRAAHRLGDPVQVAAGVVERLFEPLDTIGESAKRASEADKLAADLAQLASQGVEGVGPLTRGRRRGAGRLRLLRRAR